MADDRDARQTPLLARSLVTQHKRNISSFCQANKAHSYVHTGQASWAEIKAGLRPNTPPLLLNGADDFLCYLCKTGKGIFVSSYILYNLNYN
jgi:hypothetical protein